MGTEAFLEDALGRCRIGGDDDGIILKHAKPAGRCVMTNIREDGTRDKEGAVLDRLKTLRANVYPHIQHGEEFHEPEAFFGTNCTHPGGEGVIKVGDRVKVLEWKKPVTPIVGKENPFGGKYVS